MKKIIKALAFILFIGALFVNSKSLTRLDNSSSLNLSNLELIQVASAETIGGSIVTRVEFELTIVYKRNSNGSLQTDEHGNYVKDYTDTTRTIYKQDLDENGNPNGDEYSAGTDDLMRQYHL